MSKQVLFSLLNQASNGTELLSILDVIVSEESAAVSNNEPTADSIEF